MFLDYNYSQLSLVLCIHNEISSLSKEKKEAKIQQKSTLAGVAELANALDLGSSGKILAGSSPVARTTQNSPNIFTVYKMFGRFYTYK